MIQRRIGVLSDVHGSLLPLELGHAALQRAGVDRIVCAGDVASFGPEPDACIAFLRAHEVATVAGNHDLAMLTPVELPDGASEREREIQQVAAWSQRQLTSESLAWLAGLPLELRLDDGFVCLHAAPGDLHRVVGPGDPKPFPPGARVVCAGHLHQPYVAEVGERIWANAGSVSRPTDGDPRGAFAIATLRSGRWQVAIERLELPLDTLCERIRAAGMPFAERVCETQRAATWW